MKFVSDVGNHNFVTTYQMQSKQMLGSYQFYYFWLGQEFLKVHLFANCTQFVVLLCVGHSECVLHGTKQIPPNNFASMMVLSVKWFSVCLVTS